MADGVRKKKTQTEYYFDYSLLIIVLFLLGFGVLMIYSVSSYEAYADYNDAAFYLKKQLVAAILGLVAMIIVANIPYHFWEKVGWLGYGLSIVLIGMVPIFGTESHGAKRWLKIPIINMSLQPAEIAKLFIIIVLAGTICTMGKKGRLWRSIAVLAVTAIVMAVPVWLWTDNLSSAIIIVGIAAALIFVASPYYKRFVVLVLLAVGIGAGAIYKISQMSMEDDINFRFKRILAWLNPEAYSQDTGFQTLQALYAIGSGGVMGKGLGQSMQKLGFIPEAQNDMIFSIICEELGLFGAVLVILMFILLLWRMMIIANDAPDLFGGLLVVGVMAQIAIQVILNIAVVTNSMPNTGISLPFISYGGTSVLFLMAEVGIVLNVAKNIQLREI